MGADGTYPIKAKKPRSASSRPAQLNLIDPQQDISAQIVRGDCIQELKKLPSNHFGLVVTSPPYFIGKAYDTSKSVDSFLELHRKLFPEIVRVLKPGGSICWQVGYHVTNNRVVPLDYLVHQAASEQSELVLRNRIIWTIRHGIHSRARFSGRHEVVLWYTKGKLYTFDLDSVRVAQLYPGKKSYKGTNRGRHSGNPLGKNPSDVWDIPNVKALHPEKTEHPCQFPTALVRRLVRALCPKGDWVLDPFAGSGSAGVAAIVEKRSFLGVEKKARYATIARKRLEAALEGTPRIREDVPVRSPKEGEAVARRPDHFKVNCEV